MHQPSLILHIPHAATAIPQAALAHFILSPEVLRQEQLKLTDWFTDELFHTPEQNKQAIVFPFSRLFMDVERFANDADEPMATKGMGVFYTKTADGRTLREPPAPEQARAWMRQHYHAHHSRVESAVKRALSEHGRAVIIDCHSFPQHCLPCHDYASPSDIAYCIGTDPYHTPEWLAAELEAALQSPAGRVVRDHPFSGSFVPTRYYRKDPRVLSVMIEVKRALYMDESTGRKNEHFPNTQNKLQSILTPDS